MRVPTLIVVGDEDEPCIKPSRFLRDTIPGAKLETIARCGHLVNIEEPAIFNAMRSVSSTAARRRADALPPGGHCSGKSSPIDFLPVGPAQANKKPDREELIGRNLMTHRMLAACCGAAMAGVAAFAAPAIAAEYKITVNRDRLVNAQNEPQNWLMMNGDYSSSRYSKLTQINRDTVKNLHMAWALALGGMQDIGQNGLESEVNPLLDNGFMYTTDGWGTVYKIDARDPSKGEFVWIADPGVRHEGNVPRSRGIALWNDLVVANLPDGRVIAINRDSGEIVWDKKVAVANEFGTMEKFFTAPLIAEGKVLVANGAGDLGTRGWIAALDVKTGNELWRWYAVPKPGEPGSETWKDKTNAWKTGGGGNWQTGSYDPDRS